MGTSQSINSGVKNDPSWGITSASASRLANKKKKELENPEKYNQKKYIKKKRDSFGKLISNYINSSGGVSNMSSGRSSRGGKAGVNSTKALGGLLNSVNSGQFEDYIKEKGFKDFHNKSKSELVNFILEDICGPTTNFDEAAAKSALDNLLDQMLENAETAEDVSLELQKYVDIEGINSILINFLGIYMFEHLFQPLEEKLFLSKGEKVCYYTMSEIKEYILEEIMVLNTEKQLSNIKWSDEKTHDEFSKLIYKNVLEVFYE